MSLLCLRNSFSSPHLWKVKPALLSSFQIWAQSSFSSSALYPSHLLPGLHLQRCSSPDQPCLWRFSAHAVLLLESPFFSSTLQAFKTFMMSSLPSSSADSFWLLTSYVLLMFLLTVLSMWDCIHLLYACCGPLQACHGPGCVAFCFGFLGLSKIAHMS